MDTGTDVRSALRQAIERAGGALNLARAIGTSPAAPGMWLQRASVPAEHCPAIERETGIPCEQLRPHVAWHVLRGAPPAPKPVEGGELRRQRLAELLSQAPIDGNKATLGRALGYASGAFVYQMLNGRRAVTDETIQAIEALWDGKFRGWFDQQQGA